MKTESNTDESKYRRKYLIDFLILVFVWLLGGLAIVFVHYWNAVKGFGF